jgi:hypothetical protein
VLLVAAIGLEEIMSFGMGDGPSRPPEDLSDHIDIDTSSWRPDQLAAATVGAAFLVAGVAGFIPGITTHLDHIAFAGHDSEAMLLGVFSVSVLHNLVHLVFGLAGQLLARTSRASDIYLIGGGVVYLLVSLYGMSVTSISSANFLPTNTADDWLHLVLGVAMIGLGVVTRVHQPSVSTRSRVSTK